MRRRALLLAPLALAALPLARAAAQGGPQGPVSELDNALLRIMQMGQNSPFAQRAGVLRPVIEQVFDLPQILQVSVGLPWNTLAEADKARLLDVFTRYTVASYVANFDSYNGQKFEIAPHARSVGHDQVVETKLVPRAGDPTRIDYEMRQTGAGWKVVDVLVDGSISRVAVQRSDFRGLLNSGGPRKLIASLERKVRNLQSGQS
jgi:phospholipid transport system substrate-binding protein